MTPDILTTIAGRRVYIDRAPQPRIHFTAGMAIDVDGSPRAYGPNDRGLDWTANAGHPGNWWGVKSHLGHPVVQRDTDPAPGFYISTTSYTRYPKFFYNDPRCYLDAEAVKFIVVPQQLRCMILPTVLGCRARVSYGGVSCEAMVGDLGPATHLGEASPPVARALGIGDNARTGGIEDGVLYEFFPGIAAPGFELQAA